MEPKSRRSFEAYQNPALSAAMTARSLQPSEYTIHCILFFSIASASTLAVLFCWEEPLFHYIIINLNGLGGQHTAHLIAKTMEGVVGLVFIGSMLACHKIFTLHGPAIIVSPSKASKDQPALTARQLQLLGLNPKNHQVASQPSEKPPPLVPLHQFTTASSRSSSYCKTRSVNSPFPASSLYHVPGGGVGGGASSLASSQHHSLFGSVVSNPWSKNKRIASEEMLELFLAQVDQKITESAEKLAIPPPSISQEARCRHIECNINTSIRSPYTGCRKERSPYLCTVDLGQVGPICSPGELRFYASMPQCKGCHVWVTHGRRDAWGSLISRVTI